ncbi:hypothetical protein BDR05DRAFT_277268 [Suillus weaverae]|nr:hypothetical protein BDR05DRAFT_277268 [Suillus weaverae]
MYFACTQKEKCRKNAAIEWAFRSMEIPVRREGGKVFFSHFPSLPDSCPHLPRNVSSKDKDAEMIEQLTDPFYGAWHVHCTLTFCCECRSQWSFFSSPSRSWFS